MAVKIKPELQGQGMLFGFKPISAAHGNKRLCWSGAAELLACCGTGQGEFDLPQESLLVAVSGQGVVQVVSCICIWDSFHIGCLCASFDVESFS